MRCDEVIRRLALPNSGEDSRGLLQHLEVCETCARWAERSAKLDRLWDATRPADPSPDVWNKLWSSATTQIDQPATANGQGSRVSAAHPALARVPPMPRHDAQAPRSRRWGSLIALAMIGVGQAAALLLAIGLSWHPSVKDPTSLPRASGVPSIAGVPAPERIPEVEVGEGQVVLIRSEGPKDEVVDLLAGELPGAMDRWYPVHNEFESYTPSEIEIDEGQIVLIRSEGCKDEVIDLAAREAASLMGRLTIEQQGDVARVQALVAARSAGVDPWYLLHNAFEWMASSVLAMAE